MPPSKTVKQRKVWDALKFGINFLTEKGISQPRLNSETLLAHVIGTERFALYVDGEELLKPWQWNLYQRLLQRRGEFVPLQYLLGSVNFFGFDFVVDKRVLIPRPETEILVERTLLKIKNFPAKVKILDLGTGCGNIALSLAKLTKAEIYATDISKNSLAVARKNSQQLKLKKRVHFLRGDCFKPLKKKRVLFHLICSSPPYLPTEQLRKSSEEINFEPEIALNGGEDGLDFFRRIIKESPPFLTKDGYLILEMGDHQSKAIKDLVKKNKFLSLESVVPDYQGIERIAVIKKYNHEFIEFSELRILTGLTGLKHNKNVVDELARLSTKVDYYNSRVDSATTK